MVLDKIVNIQLLQNKPIFAIPIGFIFVLLGFISSALIFPSELSIVIVALSSLLILPYVIKIFEIDELNIDLDEIVDVSELKIQDLEKWVKKCLNDGYSPTQIRESLIKNNLVEDFKSGDKNFILITNRGREFSVKYLQMREFEKTFGL